MNVGSASHLSFAWTALEGIWSVFGEFEWSYHGVSREQMALILSVGFGASLIMGTSLGVLSDIL